jgi:hypothetical protein
MRRMLPHALLLVVLSEAATPCFSQTKPNLQTYFKDYIGLSEDQIAAVRGGQAVAKTCTPAHRRRSSFLARSTSMPRLTVI